jgi:outer membrane lipase/esterase
VFFGDSLTDAGTYGFRFTTNPGMTWAQHIAMDFGQSTDPNEHVGSYDDVYQGKSGIPGPGGMNFAEGGARANKPYSVVSQNPNGTPISAEVQVQRYRAEHGSFQPNQLVTLYIGTNDVALNYDPRFDAALANGLRDDQLPSPQVMTAERRRVQDAAAAEAQTVREILANGAQHVLVFKLFDLSYLPWFETAAARDYVQELTTVYNEQLLARLPQDPRVAILDTAAFVDDLVANAGRYGFSHAAGEDACTKAGQDYCDPDGWKEPNADRTYIFAASEHFTTHAHELLADYVRQQIARDVAPG